MHEKILKKAGLTDVQAEIYSFLLENGEFKASEIGRKIKRPRGVVYKGLDDLILLNLVQKIENKGITRFKANHPGNIEKIFEDKEKKAIEEIKDRKNRLEIEKKSVTNTLPDLISIFNLNNSKPGILYYEGEDGIKKVLEDSLTSKTTIRTYADIEAIVKYIDKINKDYVEKRDKLGIKKRAILVDSPFGRKYLKEYHKKTTYIKFIDHKLFPFESVMQIYDGKISYITLSEKSMIGVIIHDPAIYQMNKSIFEHMWNTSKTFDQLPPLSKAQ